MCEKPMKGGREMLNREMETDFTELANGRWIELSENEEIKM